MAPRPRPSRRRAAVLAVAVVAVGAVLAGCGVGERPTLDDAAPVPGTGTTRAPLPTGVVEVDALLARLDGTASVAFTATYRITRKLGNVGADASVVQAPPRTAVTVGDVRFVVGDGADRTCDVPTATCEPGRLDQRVSDLMIGSRFYAEGPAAALRVAMGRRTGDAVVSTREVAGLSVDCVTVPVGAGGDVTCVTPAGPIAVLDTAALLVELQSWSDTPDETQFAP